MTAPDQDRTLLDHWLDAHREPWQREGGQAEGPAAPGQAEGSAAPGQAEGPAAPDLAGPFAQWQQAAAQGFAAWAPGAEPFAQALSRQLIDAQTTLLRLVELTATAWQGLAPKLAAGAAGEGALREAAEQLRRQIFPDPTRAMATAQDLGSLWGSYMEELQQLTRPWAELPGAPGLPGGEGASAMMQLTSLYWDAYERSLGRLAASPRMGFSRELEAKLLRGFAAWSELRRASADFQLVVADIWTGVFAQVLRELSERGRSGQPIQSLHELLRHWTSVADRELEQAFGGERFLAAQGRMFNAAMRYRLHEQQIVELSLKGGHLPTRGEVDEVHRSLYELRKEVKALRKELREARSKTPQA